MSEVLTEKNFILFAARHYDNPCCSSTSEFHDDVKRVRYLKKMLGRYKKTGEIKERLALNHVVCLANVFGPHVLPRILALKMPDLLPQVKPFLVAVGMCPDVARDVGGAGRDVYLDAVVMDPGIVRVLRESLPRRN